MNRLTNYHNDLVDISQFLGQTFTSVEHDEETIVFSNSHVRYEMYHRQDCCEYVRVEDICGDLQDLVGSPITRAEDPESRLSADGEESATWTFYKLDTVKGGVTIRWFGESNGYYSESVDIFKMKLDFM
jgi:hypothetical protein